jgi:hypothetical protein
MRITALILSLAVPVLAGCETHAERAGPRSAAVGDTAEPSAAQESAARLSAPAEPLPRASLTREDLPAVVRDALRDRMQRHGDSMESLLWSSVNLQYELIVQRAEWVVLEPRISRPQGSESSALINELLPRRFFDLQDELHGQAVALADAARRRDDEGIARTYGAMTSTCIRCHSLYLRLPAWNSAR